MEDAIMQVKVRLDDSQVGDLCAAWLNDDDTPTTVVALDIRGQALEDLEDRLSQMAADRVLVALRKRFDALRDDD
jgi:hypothetical protein